MSLVPWTDPFHEFEDLFNRLPSLGVKANLNKGFVPAVDMYETKKDVIVELPLAGINPQDVNVSVEKGILTVQGETSHEHEVEEKNYYRKEIRTGSFYRQIALPVPVKEDKISAEFSDGILKIVCPKTSPIKAKKIAVKIVKKNKK